MTGSASIIVDKLLRN